MADWSYFKNHPLRIAKDMSHVTIGQVQKAATSHCAHWTLHPTAGAYMHYGGVEIADRLVIEKPDADPETVAEAEEAWDASCGDAARQLMFYVWKIIFREMRHGNKNTVLKAWPAGPKTPAQNLIAAICVHPNGHYEDCLNSMSHVSALEAAEACEHAFRNGGWGTSFGGSAWADIALQMVKYLRGDMSLMMAADRCWTLVHNDGPIFNKGFYFCLHDAWLTGVLEWQAKSSVFDIPNPFHGPDFLSGYDGAHKGVNDAFRKFRNIGQTLLESAQKDEPSEPKEAPKVPKYRQVVLGPFTYEVSEELV